MNRQLYTSKETASVAAVVLAALCLVLCLLEQKINGSTEEYPLLHETTYLHTKVRGWTD